ncbi:hypothetical protein D3C71_1536670 [compost metagenome]
MCLGNMRSLSNDLGAVELQEMTYRHSIVRKSFAQDSFLVVLVLAIVVRLK